MFGFQPVAFGGASIGPVCIPPTVNLAGPMPNTSPAPVFLIAPNNIYFGTFFTPISFGDFVSIDLSEFFSGGPITSFSHVSGVLPTSFSLSGNILSGTSTDPYNEFFVVRATSACGTADLNIYAVLISP